MVVIGDLMSKISIRFNNWFERNIQPQLRKMVGLDDYFRESKERIETIEYIINHSLDITKMSKSTGEQRQMQIIGAEVLRIVHEVCVKYGLSYWIDWGTLLGAVRHGGFVPWDDDLDISMPIDDFKKACKIFPDEFNKYKDYGLFAEVTNYNVMAVTLWHAGVLLDVVATDNMCFNKSKDEIQARYKVLIDFQKNSKDLSFEEKFKKQYEIMGENNNDNPIWYQPGYNNEAAIFENNIIFPINTVLFEGYRVCAPKDIQNYLKICYGDYMSFPKSGILKHHGGKGKPLHYNITKYSLNTEDLLSRLRALSPLSNNLVNDNT